MSRLRDGGESQVSQSDVGILIFEAAKSQRGWRSRGWTSRSLFCERQLMPFSGEPAVSPAMFGDV